MFFGKHIDQFIYETMAYIAMAGLGVTVAEKFSSKPQSTPPTILKPPADPPVRNTRND
jgi:hypothetical protein